jgi:hypothetical protein
MSQELLEFSVLVDEKFDIKFSPVKGLMGFILRLFGN